MNQSATVHRAEDIEQLLKIGLAPITDNALALRGLGFARAYPTARNRYEASMYARSVDRGSRATPRGSRHVLICERAFLLETP